MKKLIATQRGEQRVRSRHPWIFAGDFVTNPGDVTPGEVVQVFNEKGHFLAAGIANPKSQIVFRALSYSKDFVWNRQEAQRRFVEAWQLRERWGFQFSARMVFGESDGLPGLIVDRYLVADEQVLVLQLNSAGSEKLLADFGLTWLEEVIRQVSKIRWEKTVLVLHRQSSSRLKEGLRVSESEVVKGKLDELQEVQVGNVELRVSLLRGQKTGLFLDQSANIARVSRYVQGHLGLRVLDLCCYVGQWSTHLAKLVPGAEVDLVDVSSESLAHAQFNVKRVNPSAEVRAIRMDVMQDWSPELREDYDLIICDPPAFVKNHKHLGAGLQGYTKLNLQALRHLAPEGMLVTCSCSGLVSSEDFESSVRDALLRSGKSLKILERGGQSADHPTTAFFPESSYLKCLVLA